MQPAVTKIQRCTYYSDDEIHITRNVCWPCTWKVRLTLGLRGVKENSKWQTNVTAEALCCTWATWSNKPVVSFHLLISLCLWDSWTVCHLSVKISILGFRPGFAQRTQQHPLSPTTPTKQVWLFVIPNTPLYSLCDDNSLHKSVL